MQSVRNHSIHGNRELLFLSTSQSVVGQNWIKGYRVFFACFLAAAHKEDGAEEMDTPPPKLTDFLFIME